MATSEYLPVAAAAGANVVPQGSFAGSAWQQNGFTTGTASAPEANKCWRQATVPGAAWAQVVTTVLGENVSDDGYVANLASQFQRVIQQIASGATSDLLARMANAEANIRDLWTASNNELIWRQWADPTLNNLVGRVATLEGWRGVIDGWVGSMNGWRDWADPTINSLWARMGDNENRDNGQDAHLGQLDQQNAQLNYTLTNFNGVPFDGSQYQRGWCRLPNGLLFQWMLGNSERQAGESDYTYGWPTGFSQVFSVQVTTIRPNAGDGHADDMFEYQVINWTNGNVRIWRARRGNDNTITTQPWILAIGL